MAVKTDPSSSAPFASHLRTALRPYHVWVPVFGAIGLSLAGALVTLVVSARSDLRMLKAIEGSVYEMVKAKNRVGLPDLLRDVSDAHQGHLAVIENGEVYASSSYEPPTINEKGFHLPTLGILLTPRNLHAEVQFTKTLQPGVVPAYLRLVTPLEHLLWPLQFLFPLVLILGWTVSKFYAYRMTRSVNRALAPLSRFEEAIRGLQTLKDPEDLYKSGIQELDSIRSAILETHRALSNAKDIIAQMKAKELTTETYEYLIHDLEKLTKALRNQIVLLSDPSLDEESREDLFKLIPETAEELLMQFTAGKHNLDFEAKVLPERDVIPVIREGVSDAWYASHSPSNVLLIQNFPDDSVPVAHDSQLLRRAIANLVHNALDACRTTVQIALIAHEKGTIIRVADDGTGIPADDVGLYFKGRKKSTKGDRQAFGLAATSHIVRSHGGRLTYQQSEWGGACFEVIL